MAVAAVSGCRVRTTNRGSVAAGSLPPQRSQCWRQCCILALISDIRREFCRNLMMCSLSRDPPTSS